MSDAVAVAIATGAFNLAVALVGLWRARANTRRINRTQDGVRIVADHLSDVKAATGLDKRSKDRDLDSLKNGGLT